MTQASRRRYDGGMAKSPYGDYYTDRAVKAMRFAHEESNRLQQDLVSPEHILLGLLREGAGVGINALSDMGIDLVALDARLTKEAERGQPRLSEAAKSVLRKAEQESLRLGHDYVGTEHLLLGLLQANDNRAAKALLEAGAEIDALRSKIVEILKGPIG